MTAEFYPAQWITLLVLMAALMHASWNAVLKVGGERIVVMMLITLGAAIGSGTAAFFLPLPAPAAWPFLVMSSLVHFGYCVFLCKAYESADLGLVYPIARGSAPALVMLFSIVLIGESMTLLQIGGVLVVTLGIISLALRHQVLREQRRGARFAAVTAIFIAGYSTLDGLGVRSSGNPHSYAAWLFIGQFLPLGLFVLLRFRRAAVQMIQTNWARGLIGGLLSLSSYWIVLWAMSVAPIPVVIALRETSVIFAVFLGGWLLKEGFSLQRLLATIMVMLGVAFIKR